MVVVDLVTRLRFYACANYGPQWANDDGPALLREAASVIEGMLPFVQNGALFDAYQDECARADELAEIAEGACCPVCPDNDELMAWVGDVLERHRAARSAR